MKKGYVIALILLVVIIVSIALMPSSKKPNKPAQSNEVTKMVLDSLRRHDTVLQLKIAKYEAIGDRHRLKYDSLQKSRSSIHEIYVNEYKKIDRAAAAELIHGFDSIFTANGVER